MAVVSECLMEVADSRSAASESFAQLRRRDFARLDAGGHVYLDYTGAALYPVSLIKRHGRSLQDAILGNPHSVNPASENSALLLYAARRKVLNYFAADPAEYAVIFTSNATGAIKLVAEGFAFDDDSELLLTTDNHNSINGIREYARAKGASVRYLSTNKDLGLTLTDQDFSGSLSHSLFAYPAQSNFSGVQHSLDFIGTAQDAGYQVLLDAAAYVPGHTLDLSAVHPDFVCVSFYKMFGYPTGIGALIARKSSLALLRRPWFAGGTVDYVSTLHPELHQLLSDEQAFEDGSANFTSAKAVIDGLDYLSEVGTSRIQAHTSSLIERLVRKTSVLRHAQGAPLVRWYGGNYLTYGGARAFNVLDRRGTVIPYERIEKLAADVSISIRGGCFCNPGCAEVAFGFPAEKALRCMQDLGDGSFSPARFANCLETTEVGALRVSLGMANNDADICRFVSFVERFRNYLSEG